MGDYFPHRKRRHGAGEDTSATISDRDDSLTGEDELAEGDTVIVAPYKRGRLGGLDGV